MAWSWFVYSKHSPKDALVVEDELRALLDPFVAARPSLVRRGAEWGDVTVEGVVPAVDDVIELSEAFGRPVSDEVLDRIELCRSALMVERPGVKELDPLQVSILRWLVARVGPCVIDWGDMQVVLSEDVLRELDDFPDAGALGKAPPPTPELAVPDEGGGGVAVAAPPGLTRSGETEQAIESLSEDPFLRRRFLRLLEAWPDHLQRYVTMLQADGAMSDADAEKRLGMGAGELEGDLARLHHEARGLAASLDED